MILKKLGKLLALRASLVYLISEEEERVERLVTAAARKVYGEECRTLIWSCLGGLREGDRVVDDQTDPVAGVRQFLAVDEPAVLVFKDLHLLIGGSVPLQRQIKDAARTLRTARKTIFFVCPILALPQELYSIFTVEDVPLPDADDLNRVLDMCVDAHPKAQSLKESLTADLRGKLIRAAQGFTSNEAWNAFRGAFLGRAAANGSCVDHVVEEKAALIRKSGVLEFVGSGTGTWEIGGLFNLKKWLKERGKAFDPTAAEQGLAAPRGILAMGISGCGKSLCVKAIASYWKLPLLRLDMGLVYDGVAGPPEQAMRAAIKTAEAVAPCVLWIDEIEAGIANRAQKASGGPESRVLALFLTWMQEKTAPVFVGATANEVEALPPEILRKGRFDELFYVGLPSKRERMEILKIHMKKRNVDPATFDMDYLAESTKGFNGAEIEQGLIAALFEASAANTPLTEHVLANSLRSIVPLSRTMRERIDKIESWARDRAMKASLSSFDGRN